jgi:hypothetical protein
MSENGEVATLALDDVVQRFADSAQALDTARQKLHALAEAEATHAAAAHGLEEASAKTAQFTEVASQLIAQAQETQQLAREVLQAGAGLIDGTDLRTLQSGLASTTSAVSDGFTRMEQLIGDIRARDQRIAELESELARRTAALSGRQRKNLGITE